MLYEFDQLSAMSNEEWKRAARRGAEYILEMNVHHFYTFNGGMCALIGLMTGAGERFLLQRNWIDEVIIDCLNRYRVRVWGGVMDTYDLDELSSGTSREIWNECVRRGIVPITAKPLFSRRFPFLQTLGQIYQAPEMR